MVATLCQRRNATVADRRYKNMDLSFFARPGNLGAAVALGEFLDPAGGIHEFLFAGEKRMTSGTDADSNITTGRTCMVDRATGADHLRLLIFWVYVRFHVSKRSANLRGLAHSRKL